MQSFPLHVVHLQLGAKNKLLQAQQHWLDWLPQITCKQIWVKMIYDAEVVGAKGHDALLQCLHAWRNCQTSMSSVQRMCAHGVCAMSVYSSSKCRAAPTAVLRTTTVVSRQAVSLLSVELFRLQAAHQSKFLSVHPAPLLSVCTFWLCPSTLDQLMGKLEA